MSRAVAFVSGSDTSKAAAESMRKSAGSIRLLILSHLTIMRDVGATCDQIERALGLRHQTASARLRELAMQRRIVDSGERRIASSGRKAAVWRVA